MDLAASAESRDHMSGKAWTNGLNGGQGCFAVIIFSAANGHSR